MNLLLIDTHCHLHFRSYAEDVDSVVLRMNEQGIGAITVGTSVANSRQAVDFAEVYKNVWATVGFHPEHLSSSFQDPYEGPIHEKNVNVEALDHLVASSKKIVAIGETGLDYFRIDPDRDLETVKKKQKDAFIAQLRLAQKHDLPLVIHCREAVDDLVGLLQDERTAGRTVRGVMHSFSGTWKQASACIDLGLYVGINGIATFPPKKSLPSERDINLTIDKMPLDRLLVETDAPFLAPVPYRGKRNEPSYVRVVAEHVARRRFLTYEDIAAQTTVNAMELFSLMQA